MDELPGSGAETGADRLGNDMVMTLMLMIEDDSEDTLSTENVVFMQLLVCLDAIEDATKTTNTRESIKTRAKCRTIAEFGAGNCRASQREYTA